MEHGLFEKVDGAERRVRGLLIPYGEQSRTAESQGIRTDPVLFAAGDITLPRDPAIVTLNLDHDRFNPIGRAVLLEQSDAGVVATFDIANTDEGDAYLSAPTKRKLSAELAGLVRKGARATARLVGAGIVAEGAFASAALFAIDPTEDQPDEDTEETVEQMVDRKIQEALTGTDKTTDEAPASEDTDAAPAAEEEEDVAQATIPATLASEGTTKKDEGLSLSGLFALITRARQGDEKAKEVIAGAGGEALFALNDVKYDGTGGLNNVQLPQFVGEVWSARRTGRQVIPQFDQGTLTDTVLKGWKFGTRPEVSTWAGNKANVPTSSPTVSEVLGAIQRFAGGNDIAREFYDFGKTDVIAALLAAYADSYADKSDAWFLAQLIAAAGSGTAVSVPVGTPAGLGKVVQGALAIVTAGGKPSVAFVAPDVFASIVYTKKDDTLEYLNAAVGTDLTDGSTQGFSIIPRGDLAAGNVLVADRNAATAYELPGSPIRVNALDMVKGGVDEAVFGYIGAMVNDTAGIVRIINAP